MNARFSPTPKVDSLTRGAEQTDLDCLTGLKELAGAFKDKGGELLMVTFKSGGEKRKKKETQKEPRVAGVKGNR